MTASSGTATSSSDDSGTFWFSARMIPPTHMIGADSSRVNVMSASIWTCWTSLVVRVISDAVPRWFTSRSENISTRRKIALPDIAAEGHRDLGAEVDRADRADDLREGDRQHHAAGRQDVVRVVEDHAVVDDVRVQRRQVQRRQRLRQLQHQQERERLAVRTQVEAQQADQHGTLSSSVGTLGCLTTLVVPRPRPEQLISRRTCWPRALGNVGRSARIPS